MVGAATARIKSGLNPVSSPKIARTCAGKRMANAPIPQVMAKVRMKKAAI